MELFALCAPTSHSSTSPLHQPSCPAASVLACMLIPHETLLILVQISCVFPTDTASDVQEADTTHYREVNTSAARADYLASPASCLLPPASPRPITDHLRCGPSVEMASKLAAVAVAQDRDRKGSRSNLANIGIHAQERRCSRQAVEKQVSLILNISNGLVTI